MIRERMVIKMKMDILAEIAELEEAAKCWRDVAVEKSDEDLHRLADWLVELKGIKQALVAAMGSLYNEPDINEEECAFIPYDDLDADEEESALCPRCMSYELMEDGTVMSCRTCGWIEPRRGVDDEGNQEGSGGVGFYTVGD
jgi:hypothetical protein